jgi:hypothetical protein
MRTVRIGFAPLVLALALLGIAAGPSAAEEERPGLDFGILGGFVYLDEDLAGPGGPSAEPTLGARIGGPFFADRLRWFADAQYYDLTTWTFRGEARSIAARGGGEISFYNERLNPIFLSLAGGYTTMSFDNATDFDSFLASVGFGQRVWIGGEKHIRWELRADHTLASDGLMGRDLTQAQFLIGLTWTKRSAPRDSDADGIVDRLDICLGSLPGEEVDQRGCPLVPRPADPEAPGVPGAIPMPTTSDTDADGVPDLQDRCPRTVRGVVVDENGCALDADGDGVPDGLGMDKCPGTPPGVIVDVHGCPLDSDGDGVYDGLDSCPDTPRGAEVDDAGCPSI